MLKQIEIRNYKALRHLSLELTPLSVLVGPNNSGKSSVLHAIQAAARIPFSRRLGDAFGQQGGGSQLVWRGDHKEIVEFALGLRSPATGTELEYKVGLRFGRNNPSLVSESSGGFVCYPAPNSPPSESSQFFAAVGKLRKDVTDQMIVAKKVLEECLSPAQMLRLEPQVLALPVANRNEPFQTLPENGFGLAALIQDILLDDRDRFDELERRFLMFFSHAQRIILRKAEGYDGPTSPGRRPGYELVFKLKNDVELPARFVSEGVMIVLAYLAVLYAPQPPKILLIEEPENSIHPSSLVLVSSILKEISERSSPRCQVIVTTHSPYLLDHFQPEQVTVLNMSDEGEVQAARLDKVPSAKKELEVFGLGEFWSSHSEAELVLNAANSGSTESQAQETKPGS